MRQHEGSVRRDKRRGRLHAGVHQRPSSRQLANAPAGSCIHLQGGDGAHPKARGCTHAHMHAHAQKHAYARTHIHTCAQPNTQTLMRMRALLHAPVNQRRSHECARPGACSHTRTYSHMRTHKRKHTSARTFTQVCIHTFTGMHTRFSTGPTQASDGLMRQASPALLGFRSPLMHTIVAWGSNAAARCVLHRSLCMLCAAQVTLRAVCCIGHSACCVLHRSLWGEAPT